MIEIIPPSKFKSIPWKNGKGMTTEFSINSGGTLDNFDWRISSAGVSEDGFFSDFNGYQRHLVLLEGEGLVLDHDQSPTDTLDEFLQIASFPGLNKTYGKLLNGPIIDLNFMARTSRYQSEISVLADGESIDLKSGVEYFFYNPKNESYLYDQNTQQRSTLPIKHLMHIDPSGESAIKFTISGECLIFMTLVDLNRA